MDPLGYFASRILCLPGLILTSWLQGVVTEWRLSRLLNNSGYRVSLHPLDHLDLMGSLCFFMFYFGWSRPSDPALLARMTREHRLDLLVTSSLAHFALCILIALSTLCFILFLDPQSPPPWSQGVFLVLAYAFVMNFLMATLVWLPLYPLPGYSLLTDRLSHSRCQKLRHYESMMAFLLLLTGFLFSQGLPATGLALMLNMASQPLFLGFFLFLILFVLFRKNRAVNP